MLIAFRIILFILTAISGWIAINRDEVLHGASFVFVVSIFTLVITFFI